ncbi:AAA family ATPase [Mangrovicella endophytica]|uniref:AAA family ATPase n=1 Tax=Mangrovicella endophytica TaxID=2066697 RepID=UPI000C9DBC67|nr:AAA family ATPase [Mangrovicella endophytica]
MSDWPDFDDMPTSLAGRLTPSARIADALLRRTLADGGASRLLGGGPHLVVVHGIAPVDGAVLGMAVVDLVGGTAKLVVQINAAVRDWTDPLRQRSGHVERLLTEASLSTRPIVVLCHRRTEVPGIVAAVADAVIPIADRCAAIADVVLDVARFRPDDKLASCLERLPLSYLNLAIRPGMTSDRMWKIAGLLRRHLADEKRERRSSSSGNRTARTPSAAPDAGSAQVGPERLEDLPGMGEAQRWGLALAADIAEYKAGSLQWSDIENGVLVHGPPGTGKTLFARALAGSCGVALHVHSVAAWQAKGHLGDLLKAMRAAFAEANGSTPCILFLDELDSVGSRDEPLGDHASYQRQVVNGLLECLDGAAQRDGVVVVGATNKPEAIDKAVLRPGRLGRHIEVRLPDLRGRVAILRHHLRGDLPDADLASVADEFGAVSGAALAQLVREARSVARRERRPLAEADLRTALPPGVLLTEAAFRRMCVHEAGHVVVGLELAPISGLVPTMATVRRRLRGAGDNQTGFEIVEGADQTREGIRAQIVVMLAGLAAEEVILASRGNLSGGTVDADLVRATRLATDLEFALGLGEGLHAVPTAALVKATLPLDGGRSRERVEQVLDWCFTEAKAIVAKRRKDVEATASRLADVTEIRLA